MIAERVLVNCYTYRAGISAIKRQIVANDDLGVERDDPLNGFIFRVDNIGAEKKKKKNAQRYLRSKCS